MASLWLYCSRCPRFCPLCEAVAQHLSSLGLQKAPALLCDWNTCSRCPQWRFQVVQRLCDLRGPLSALNLVNFQLPTPGVNIFCANKYLPAQSELSSSTVHCGVTSSS